MSINKQENDDQELEEIQLHEKVEQFTFEFKLLVRKFCPEYDPDFLIRLQERTSCFNPYVWSDK